MSCLPTKNVHTGLCTYVWHNATSFHSIHPLYRHLQDKAIARKNMIDLAQNPSKKICDHCRFRKQKCKGGWPCDACTKKKQLCSFSDSADSPRSLSSPELLRADKTCDRCRNSHKACFFTDQSYSVCDRCLNAGRRHCNGLLSFPSTSESSATPQLHRDRLFGSNTSEHSGYYEATPYM